MLMIKDVERQIAEEIDGAEEYAKCAVAKKEDYPDMARMYYELAQDELDHMSKLHAQIAELIADYRKRHGDAPEAMQAVYDYLHEKQIEEVADIKVLLAVYRE